MQTGRVLNIVSLPGLEQVSYWLSSNFIPCGNKEQNRPLLYPILNYFEIEIGKVVNLES